MKLKPERDLSYIDPLIADFFLNNRTSSIIVILLTNGLKDERKGGLTDRQTVAILIKMLLVLSSLLIIGAFN